MTDAKEFVDEFYEKNPWIKSRLWDDDCECETEDVVLSTCPRHGDNKDEYFKNKERRMNEL
jgi:hypothetical protein